MSPCPLLFVYVLLLQHVVFPFCEGNLFGCGQLCHTQNRRAPSVFDQSCLLADCSLALFGQSPDGSRRSVQQAVSPVAFAAGHGPPLPLICVWPGHVCCPHPLRHWLCLSSCIAARCVHSLCSPIVAQHIFYLLCSKYEFRHPAELGGVSSSEDLPA